MGGSVRRSSVAILDELDVDLSHKSQYEMKKQKSIDSLKRALTWKHSAFVHFNLLRKLYAQYASYQYDSAYVYAQKMNHLAHELHDINAQVEGQCNIVFCLLSAGLFNEASETLDSIDIHRASLASRKLYFTTASRCYFDMADFTHANPYMDRYIEKNMEIQKIFQDFAAPDDIFPYSIDEGFLDLTSSINYFIPDQTLDRRTKLDLLAARIQQAIWKKTGIYSSIGLSNANPLLAKLALDIEAKHTKKMRVNWSYEDVPSKVWTIPTMTDFWGIGHRTATRLKKLGIHSIYDLAHFNPDILKKEMGVMGLQLWFHAHGIDESNVHKPYQVKSHGLGNSQILPRDYRQQAEIELVFREMAEQVAIRLRRSGKKCQRVSIYARYSKQELLPSIHTQKKIEPTNNSDRLAQIVVQLFRSKYQGGAIRQIGVFYNDFVDQGYSLISLFDDPLQIQKEEELQQTIDHIRDRFGFASLLKGNALLDSSRAIARSKLTGGHSAGGLEGLS